MAGFSGDLNRYDLGEQLGAPGGYGVAFRATRDDGALCVIKLIHGFTDPSHDELRRLEIMLARLAEVKSSHVVPIIDAGIDGGQAGGRLPWLAMPEKPGAQTLEDLLRKHRLSTVQVKQIACDIACGLGDLHHVGALHRDLKPGNILIDRHGRAWLIDFDLIKILDLTTRTPRREEPLGTTVYMAPEQFLGPIVRESDLWSFGLVLVEMLTGKQPVLEVARARGDVRRAVLGSRLVPAQLEQPWQVLVPALLRKVPAARPSNAHELARWIDCPSGPAPVPPQHFGAPKFRWHVQSADEVDAIELLPRGRLNAAAVDVSGLASAQARRLQCAARSLGVHLSIDSPLASMDQMSIEDVIEGSGAPGGEPDRFAISRLRAQRESVGDIGILPWRNTEEVGIDEAIHTLRIGLRNRHMLGDRPVLATVQCPLATVLDERRSLEFASALSALDPDGWRLLIDGLDPGCGSSAIAAAMDLAEALASRSDVWVRASGLARWAFASRPGISVIYRAGRGLWTRQRTRRGGVPLPERVEVRAFGGPVPRNIAERLELVRPDLVHCTCAGCRGRGLPALGSRTVVHNVIVLSEQMARVSELPPHERKSHVKRILLEARTLRLLVGPLVEWHGERADVDAVLRVLDGKARPRGRKTRLVEFA